MLSQMYHRTGELPPLFFPFVVLALTEKDRDNKQWIKNERIVVAALLCDHPRLSNSPFDLGRCFGQNNRSFVPANRSYQISQVLATLVLLAQFEIF